MKSCPKKNPWILNAPNNPRPDPARAVQVILVDGHPGAGGEARFPCNWWWGEGTTNSIFKWRYAL